MIRVCFPQIILVMLLMSNLQPPSKNSKVSPAIITSKNKFQSFADYIWPVHKEELAFFLSMTGLMFCILFNQNLLRAIKDSVVIPNMGNEATSFIKFSGVLPAAILMSVIYVKLINIFKPEKVFYIIMTTFLVFFGIFAFMLFPNRSVIHMSDETTANLISSFPHLKWFIILVSNWSYSLFYTIAELWSNAVFALLFWQFANTVTTIEQSKRFYPLFGLLGQTGLFISGKYLEVSKPLSNYIVSNFELSINTNVVYVQVVIGLVLVLGVISLMLFWMLNNKVISPEQVAKVQFKPKKSKLSLAESFKFVISSKYIMLIATLLVCYGVAINLVEAPWKAQAGIIYPTEAEYGAFVGQYLKYNGILTIMFVLIGSNLVRKVGWFSTAIITPIIAISTGLLFFGLSNFEEYAEFLLRSASMTDPILLAVIAGAVMNVLIKSSKYTLFDSTKEMSYVPLEEELKTKGKAAADVIGVKLGKSMSAFFQMLLFTLVPSATYDSISKYLMVLFIIVCIIWLWAVKELNKEYTALSKSKDKS